MIQTNNHLMVWVAFGTNLLIKMVIATLVQCRLVIIIEL